MSRRRSHEGVAGAEVRDPSVAVTTTREDPGIWEARSRFGGLDLEAAIAGVLATIGAIVLIGGIAAAVGNIAYELDDADEVSIGAALAGAAVLIVSFFIGGWVAGRVARYDGARNGFAAGLLFLVLAAGLAGLGAWLEDEYDVFGGIDLPQWFADGDSARAIVSAIVAGLLSLAAATLGGLLGTRYHRRADLAISRTRDGGVAVPSVVTPVGYRTDPNDRFANLPPPPPGGSYDAR